MTYQRDLVKCNNCGIESTVDFDVDTCPSCEYTGGLSDVWQNVEEL